MRLCTHCGHSESDHTPVCHECQHEAQLNHGIICQAFHGFAGNPYVGYEAEAIGESPARLSCTCGHPKIRHDWSMDSTTAPCLITTCRCPNFASSVVFKQVDLTDLVDMPVTTSLAGFGESMDFVDRMEADLNEDLNEALVQSDADAIKAGLQWPFVQVSLSTLGGDERASVMITVGLDPRESWSNGIFENSRYGRFSYNSDGSLEMFTGSRGTNKFRKTRANGVQQAIDKINAWASGHDVGEAAGDLMAGEGCDKCGRKMDWDAHDSATLCKACANADAYAAGDGKNPADFQLAQQVKAKKNEETDYCEDDNCPCIMHLPAEDRPTDYCEDDNCPCIMHTKGEAKNEDAMLPYSGNCTGCGQVVLALRFGLCVPCTEVARQYSAVEAVRRQEAEVVAEGPIADKAYADMQAAKGGEYRMSSPGENPACDRCGDEARIHKTALNVDTFLCDPCADLARWPGSRSKGGDKNEAFRVIDKDWPGKWVVAVNGQIYGVYDTREEAEDWQGVYGGSALSWEEYEQEYRYGTRASRNEDQVVFCKSCDHAEKFHLPSGCLGCKSQSTPTLGGLPLPLCKAFVPGVAMNIEGIDDVGRKDTEDLYKCKDCGGYYDGEETQTCPACGWPMFEAECDHNEMVPNDSATHAWKCAKCGYVYGPPEPCNAEAGTFNGKVQRCNYAKGVCGLHNESKLKEEGGWNDSEAIEQEKFDADQEMADLQRAGNRAARGLRRVKQLKASGDLAGAAAACPHDWTGPAPDGSGIMCNHCGSLVTDFRGTVIKPCVFRGDVDEQAIDDVAQHEAEINEDDLGPNMAAYVAKNYPSDSAKPRRTRKIGFEDWMKAADMASGGILYDLPDCPFNDWYEEGLSPFAAAKRAMRSANESFVDSSAEDASNNDVCLCGDSRREHDGGAECNAPGCKCDEFEGDFLPGEGMTPALRNHAFKEAKLSEGPGNAVPIGYTYEADYHCPDCTEKRFGGWKGSNRWIEGVDNEGNEIHPVYSWDEGNEAGDYCGDCGEEINEPHHGYDPNNESKVNEEYTDIGDGYYLSRAGLDGNGNYSVWVAKGSGRSQKLQTNGNVPLAHQRSVDELVADPAALDQIKAWFKSNAEKGESALNNGNPDHRFDIIDGFDGWAMIYGGKQRRVAVGEKKNRLSNSQLAKISDKKAGKHRQALGDDEPVGESAGDMHTPECIAANDRSPTEVCICPSSDEPIQRPSMPYDYDEAKGEGILDKIVKVACSPPSDDSDDVDASDDVVEDADSDFNHDEPPVDSDGPEDDGVATICRECGRNVGASHLDDGEVCDICNKNEAKDLFAPGDIVVARRASQGMMEGSYYTVVSVDRTETPIRTIVEYRLTSGNPMNDIWVPDLDLFCEKVDGMAEATDPEAEPEPTEVVPVACPQCESPIELRALAGMTEQFWRCDTCGWVKSESAFKGNGLRTLQESA